MAVSLIGCHVSNCSLNDPSVKNEFLGTADTQICNFIDAGCASIFISMFENYEEVEEKPEEDKSSVI